MAPQPTDARPWVYWNNTELQWGLCHAPKFAWFIDLSGMFPRWADKPQHCRNAAYRRKIGWLIEHGFIERRKFGTSYNTWRYEYRLTDLGHTEIRRLETMGLSDGRKGDQIYAPQETAA